jgi:hypothetical protein
MSTLQESFITLSTLALVVALLAVMVLAFRKRKHRHHSGLSRSAWPESAHKQPPIESDFASANGQIHRRHRKRRKEHRQRNPTLAETGGLPPARPDDVPPPGL